VGVGLQIIKLIRSNYLGEEFLVEYEGMYKRSKSLSRKAIGGYRDRITERLNLLSRFQEKFLYPDFVDLNESQPLFLFPFHDEVDLKNIILEEPYRIEVAMQLMTIFEGFHHTTSEGFGIWGLPELLISDRLTVLPPLWVDFSPDAVRTLFNRPEVIVPPEIREGKLPSVRSDVYTIGSLLKLILPEEEREHHRDVIQQMTDPNPAHRPLHFSRLFRPLSIPVSLDLRVLAQQEKRDFSSPHIIERDGELKEFLGMVEKTQPNHVSSCLVHGSTRVGKSTFLVLGQQELRNRSWKTIVARNAKEFCQELLQLSENPEWAGVNENDFQYLWNLPESFNLDRVSSVVGKLMGLMDFVGVFIDDFELADDRFRKLLQNLQEMILPCKLILVCAQVGKPKNLSFDFEMELKPFNETQTLKLLELLLGVPFLEHHRDKANWIFKITGGFPGYIFNLLNLLYQSKKLVLENGNWNISDDMTALGGFGEYVKTIFRHLGEEDRFFISRIACLSEKFSQEELDLLCQFFGKEKEKSLKESFFRLQELGLFFLETHWFRFSLEEIWEQSYSHCPEETRKELHLFLAQGTSLLSKKAWHFQSIGFRRSAANVFIQASRKAFERHEGFQLTLQWLEEAFKLLHADEVTTRMRAFRAYLLCTERKEVSCEDLAVLVAQEPYFYLALWEKNNRDAHQEVENMVQQKYGTIDPTQILEEKGKRFYILEALFQLAVALDAQGKLDRAIGILREIVAHSEHQKGYFFKELNIYSYDLLARIHFRKNAWDMAYSISQANIERAKKNQLHYTLPTIYNTEGTILYSFGPNYAQPVFEKALEVSNQYFSIRKSLGPLIEMANGFLYTGEISKMFAYLEKVREIARIFHEKDFLARSYVIEGLFHTYNRQLDEALDDFHRATELTDSVVIRGNVARLTALLYLMCREWSKFEKATKNPIPSMMDFGFSDVADIFFAKGKEEIKEAFVKFRDNNQLWLEEVGFGFVEKLSKTLPEELEQFLDSAALSFLRTHQRLSLALVYEAMAHHFHIQGMIRKAKKFAREALEQYLKLNMNNTARLIHSRFFQAEESHDDLLRRLTTILHSDPPDPENALQLVQKLERGLVDQKNEIEVLREIISFSKTLNASSDPNEILSEFSNWLVSMVPLSKVVILVISDDRILYQNHLLLDGSHFEDLKDTILFKHPTSTRSPFEIKSDFFIDEARKVILYLANDKLLLSTEEFEKTVRLVEHLEPIMSIGIVNAISYKTSILDPLTGLYTRWYYTQRLEEEYEKSLRFSTPISVIMGDIDHFKTVNDTYGHKFGDEILVEIARILKEDSRKYDIVGRYGGEEFIIILPNTNGEEAFLIAERMRKKIAQNLIRGCRASMSFGVSCTGIGKHVSKAQNLVSLADKALYHSKNNGRNLTSKAWVLELE